MGPKSSPAGTVTRYPMRISVVACELPHPDGTAAGRDLWAWCEGLRSLGHDLDAWVWFRSPSSPTGPVPEWCRFEPYDIGPMWKAHLSALLRPRGDVARAGWRPSEGAVAIADHTESAAAVAPYERSVTTLHYRSLADAWAVRHVAPWDVQQARAERRAGRRASLTLAYSARVGRHLRRQAQVVPLGTPIPPSPIPGVEEPVAAILADWSWPPNRRALALLLTAWPGVSTAVPGARLLLAGRSIDQASIGTLAGVEVIGPVARSEDVLERAAVIAFPCPNSTGPKMKVIEALGFGVPVVTTPAGVEGIVLDPGTGAIVAEKDAFATALTRTLRSPELRAHLGPTGRDAIVKHHSPEAVARARLQAFDQAFGPP